MLSEPLAPSLYEMKVAWTLLRVCANKPRFVRYLSREQADVISCFKYLDHEPTGEDVQRAQQLLEGEAA